MRVLHLADLHLGFRAYTRLNSAGINQREADVAATFSRAIDLIIGRAPELVIIAGDVFHAVRPSNAAILHAMHEFGRLRRALNNTEVVMVAGNHDTPRTSEAGCILPLFRGLGIHVADGAPQRFLFSQKGLAVLAVPDAMHERPVFEPDPRARYNVCVAHLEVAGLITARRERTDLEVPLEQLAVERFQYVGVGHYHVHRQLAPNACYAGSIDYTSTNPWGELDEERAAGLRGKYIVEFDLETGVQHLYHLPPARPLIDLPVISAAGMSPRDLDDALEANLASVAVDGAIIRQVVHDVPRTLNRELDHKSLRRVKAKAMHFHLDMRRPEIAERGKAVRVPPKSLDVRLIEVIERNGVGRDVDLTALKNLALEYLKDAEKVESNKLREQAIGTFAREEVA